MLSQEVFQNELHLGPLSSGAPWGEGETRKVAAVLNCEANNAFTHFLRQQKLGNRNSPSLMLLPSAPGVYVGEHLPVQRTKHAVAASITCNHTYRVVRVLQPNRDYILQCGTQYGGAVVQFPEQFFIQCQSQGAGSLRQIRKLILHHHRQLVCEAKGGMWGVIQAVASFQCGFNVV